MLAVCGLRFPSSLSVFLNLVSPSPSFASNLLVRGVALEVISFRPTPGMHRSTEAASIFDRIEYGDTEHLVCVPDVPGLCLGLTLHLKIFYKKEQDDKQVNVPCNKDNLFQLARAEIWIEIDNDSVHPLQQGHWEKLTRRLLGR